MCSTYMARCSNYMHYIMMTSLLNTVSHEIGVFFKRIVSFDQPHIPQRATVYLFKTENIHKHGG